MKRDTIYLGTVSNKDRNLFKNDTFICFWCHNKIPGKGTFLKIWVWEILRLLEIQWLGTGPSGSGEDLMADAIGMVDRNEEKFRS